MTDSSSEAKFSVKLISLILNTGKIALSCRLKHELKKTGVTFQDFLSINKHALFHLYEKKKCCKCVQTDQRRKSILSKPQWEILFKDNLKQCNKQRPCLCQYESQDNVSEEDLDLSLLCSILLNMCSLLPAELQDIKNLREKRNSLIHRKNGNIEEDIFQREFAFIRSTIESIAYPCGTEVFARVTEAIDKEDSTDEKLSSRPICQDLEQRKTHFGMQPKRAHDVTRDKQEQCTSVKSNDWRDEESCDVVSSDILNERNNESSKMYFQETTKGTETIHRAHAMIVGCAGAGKTTLLRRLMRQWHIPMNLCSTVGLEIHQDLFEINPESFTLKDDLDTLLIANWSDGAGVGLEERLEFHFLLVRFRGSGQHFPKQMASTEDSISVKASEE